MTTNSKIAFIYTELQKNIFFSTNCAENTIIISPKHREHIFKDKANLILIENTDQKLTLFKSRRLIHEVNEKVRRVTKNEPFTLWLASCDNPIGQIIVNQKNCTETILIEDGIGSYVKHAPLDIDKGIRAFARKIKYFLFLFPHYRSIHGIGSLKADKYLAINKNAFPRSKKEAKLISSQFIEFLEKTSKNKCNTQINENQVLYLDQPLLRNGLCRKLIIKSLTDFLKKTECSLKFEEYIIKPHPTSTPEETNETINIFKKLTNKKVRLIKTKESIEEIAISKNFNPALVFSFLSSGLYTIKAIKPKIKINGILHIQMIKNSRSLVGYSDAFRKIGIEVIVSSEAN